VSELELLAAIAVGNVSWRASRTYHVRRRDTYRLWSDEDNYTIITHTMDRLDPTYWTRFGAAGYGFGGSMLKGGVELTGAGKRRLAELRTQETREGAVTPPPYD
jgi:hypothetical protein